MKPLALLLGTALWACGSTSETPASSPDASSPTIDGGSTDPGPADAGAFTLTAEAFKHNGTLPAEYTCDGAGHSPALAWSTPPAGTQQYALLMTTLARDGLKWNWVLYGIPASARSLAAGSSGVGTAGLTSDGPNLAYSPPCSQGPGAKSYTFTLYALSSAPSLPAEPRQVTGALLTTAIQPLTLASSALTVSYTRP